MVITQARPALSRIWRALEAVPDPEVPVLSVLELGIARGFEWDRDDRGVLRVKLTPTYSGCPATSMISESIRTALLAIGVPRVCIDVELSPAWTTAWITPAAHRKLRDYGIAPPARTCYSESTPSTNAFYSESTPGRAVFALRRHDNLVPCPRCGSRRTQLVSQFGSTACKAHYRCTECLEPFEYFKPL